MTNFIKIDDKYINPSYIQHIKIVGSTITLTLADNSKFSIDFPYKLDTSVINQSLIQEYFVNKVITILSSIGQDMYDELISKDLPRFIMSLDSLVDESQFPYLKIDSIFYPKYKIKTTNIYEDCGFLYIKFYQNVNENKILYEKRYTLYTDLVNKEQALTSFINIVETTLNTTSKESITIDNLESFLDETQNKCLRAAL